MAGDDLGREDQVVFGQELGLVARRRRVRAGWDSASGPAPRNRPCWKSIEGQAAAPRSSKRPARAVFAVQSSGAAAPPLPQRNPR